MFFFLMLCHLEKKKQCGVIKVWLISALNIFSNKLLMYR